MPQKSYIYELDQVTFQLDEKHDFDWITKLGTVFQVFDQQDSGNISFGIEKSGRKYFVKYAGARLAAFSGNTNDAISRLRAAIPLYEQLKHPSLIELVDHIELESGYAAIFQWFEGESLHPHWSFPPPAKYVNPASPYFRFKQLPAARRLLALDRIFAFHSFIEQEGVVAVDFYDGSLLYDFGRNEMKICDIDVYQRKPFINTMGRLWGSSRFMSPEEFIMGAPIDEISNVYTMGAAAFALLGAELDRSYAKWDAGEGLYNVAIKAVSPDRESRFASVSAFKSAWDAAL
ncbi:serine/threonine protein kinase [Paenibacillus sinopodophylli]|uniref:serine/threonine protein kinase n=1 Tax=Paenibacillus sinopodophylli TaxID=1837342 RepID=UPI00110CD31A|nr:serine/threonine protein kinase [Paenibacillus sinopodophylli]